MSRVWLVCYDIADKRRRLAVAAVLEARGLRVLESVFEVPGGDLAALRQELLLLMDTRADGLRFYPLCADCGGAVAWQGGGAASVEGHWFWL